MHQSQGSARWTNQLLESIPQTVMTLLQKSLSQVPLSQGFICFDAGEPIRQVYFPISGLISLVICTAKGKVVETGVIGREGAAGLQGAIGRSSAFTRGIVQIAGSFYTIAAEPLRQAIATSEEAKALVNRYTEVLLAEAQQLTVCNALHLGSARLARWLLQAADRTGSERLALTQEFLGEMLAMRRTSVTLCARELHQLGAINYSRGKITIVDHKTLQTCACECYHVIQELFRNVPRLETSPPDR
jgi:CRP-like cAMP-binding protein